MMNSILQVGVVTVQERESLLGLQVCLHALIWTNKHTACARLFYLHSISQFSAEPFIRQ